MGLQHAARACALLLALMPSASLALFEDQAGSFDWYKQHIGQISNAAFHPTKPRVCVSTRRSVVGCLNLRDGSIAWRKHMGDDDLNGFAVAEKPATLLALTGSTVLQAFDTADGFLRWQKRLAAPQGDSSAAAVAATAKGVVVLRQGDVKVGMGACCGRRRGAACACEPGTSQFHGPRRGCGA